jgi:signal transduction histidine kinase/ActR/RegA family two-component response regulator
VEPNEPEQANLAATACAVESRVEERVKNFQEEARILEILNRVGASVAAELDLERAVQVVTDAARELTGAAFGAFFYNVEDDHGEKYLLYTLSGAPREAFAKFPMPRNTAVFAPTFRGEAIVRSEDITQDSRFGQNPPHFGMPHGHLPVCSYLAVPVVSRSGEVLGGLFFGHPQRGIFTGRAERLVTGIASQAAIAIDNARLYRALREREEALARLNVELEKRVEARTAELAGANRQLMQQIEERERMDNTLRQIQRLEAIGQLTSGVAHDFNNILTVVLGNLRFLEKTVGSAGGKLTQRLSNMRTAAERGAKLTAQLLAFSRRQRLEPKPIDLNELIESLGDLMRSTMGGSVGIDMNLAAELWPAFVDPTQLELVILNLALNARDAMKVGGTVFITTSNVTLGPPVRPEEPPEGEYVMICVKDSGSGMTDEVLGKCLEPFFTTKEIGKGSGLGLSQVLGFVKQSGGGLQIETEVGKGTAVKVYLPRVDSALVARHTHVQQSSERKTQATKPVILVVDDDPGVRDVTASILRERNYEVEEAGGAEAALRMLDRLPVVDLLLVDFAMPGINGADLARCVNDRYRGTPLLFVTGYADTASLTGIPEEQIVRKPFNDDQLAERVGRAIASLRQAPEGRRD